jgi:surface antigen
MRAIALLFAVLAFPLAAWPQFSMEAICASAPGSRPVAVGGGYGCQCPDGSLASMGVPCRRVAPPPKPASAAKPKPADQIYCGTSANNLSYFCPAGTACAPGNLKSCTGTDGKTQAAIEKSLTPAQRQAAESQKKAASLSAEKINAERAKMAPVPGLDPQSAAVAKLSVSAGLVSSAAQFAQLGSKTQAAIPTQTSSAGLKGWVRGDEAKGLTPEGRGYCTDYVRAIWPQITGKPLPAGLGDAGQWYEKAKQSGLKTTSADAIGHVPPGSIAVWSDGKAGHVAVVVRNDGKSLQVTEANWGKLSPGATRFEKDNIITSSFNKHEERTLGYTQAQSRGGSYKLVGFIVPE